MSVLRRLMRRGPISGGSSAPLWPEGLGRTEDGRWTVLFFFPRADTPGCTRQACALARQPLPDSWVVVGVSPDLPASLLAFRAKYRLDYPLVSDASGKLARAYGVRTRRGLRRCSFVIDPHGLVRAALLDADPLSHRDDLLAAARRAGAPT